MRMSRRLDQHDCARARKLSDRAISRTERIYHIGIRHAVRWNDVTNAKITNTFRRIQEYAKCKREFNVRMFELNYRVFEKNHMRMQIFMNFVVGESPKRG